MNLQSMREIAKLRYKLMWAKTRFRNGRIALFAVGCLLLAMLLFLLSAGGIGAGIVAVRSGKSELVAQAVLGGLFLEALFGAVLVGFGLNTVFTDGQLRRYPITALERHVTRHVIGLADPFWFLIASLEIGFAVGLCVLGDANPPAALGAILLLFPSNYLLARILGIGIDRLVSRNAGFVFLVVLILIITVLPVSLMGNHQRHVAPSLQVLRWTPPFAAAACMTKRGVGAAFGFVSLALWLLALSAALIYIENLQPVSQTVRTEDIPWENPFDWVGSCFGPRNGPLVAFWLRFYWRNNRLRAMYVLSLPVTAFLTFQFGNGIGKLLLSPGQSGADRMFLVALGAIFIVSFLAMSRFAVNQFGYLGGGFRRFPLLPSDPSASLRAGSWASMLVGGSLIPAALLLWILFSGPFDPRKLIMLLGSAVTGLFAQHAAALWVTLYGPRKLSYNSAAGNDMSVMGNIVVMGSTTCALFAPHFLAKRLPGAVSPDNWWGMVFIAGAAILLYALSLRATGKRFARKREELLAVLEGRVR